MKRTLLWSIVLIVALCGPLLQSARADAPPPFALVKDINTAPQPTNGVSGNTLFAALDNAVLFSGSTPQTGRELWRSDGSDSGTTLVKDINIGENTGLGYDSTGWLVLNNVLLFQGNDGALGTELWRSDGTAAGTTLLQDLWPGAASGTPKNFTAVGDHAFFTAQISETQQGLWSTDGTTGGTTLLHAFSTINAPFVVMGSVLMFSAAENGNDVELWKSDGTPGGTTLVKDINPGNAGSYPQRLFARSTSQIFFSADDGTHGQELWKSDGTEAGTVLVKDINPGSHNSNPADITLLPGGIIFFDSGRIVFSAYDDAHGRELWITDGTESGTQLIKDVNPNAPSAAPSPLGIASSRKGRAHGFFAMTDGANGNELWITDGTFTNTLMLADINPGAGSSDPGKFVFAGSSFFFTAANAVSGRELWKTDGSAPGTAQVADINPGAQDSRPQDLTTFNGKLYFTADDGAHGRELWSSDGSTTILLKDVRAGPDSGVQKVLGVALGALYFIGDDGTTGQELWKTDGTPDGTVQVKNIAPDVGGINLYNHSNATALGDKLVFAPDSTLWQSDGTEAGTTVIKSFPTTSNTPRPSDLTTLGDGVLFSGSDSSGVTELWRSDGTATNTSILTNTVKPYFGSVHDFARLNDLVVFGVYTGTLPMQNRDFESLWKTDGTPQGTQLIKKDVEGYSYTASGNTLFFAGSPADTSDNTELWKTDGTPGGTMLVKEIGPGDTGSDPRDITPGKPGEVFFVARAGSDGYQLWRSDGTEAGTVLVHDVRSSDDKNEYGELAYVNGTLYFTADDGIHGWELWKSDGTDGGTVMVADLYPGAGASAPQELVGLNGVLYFSATRPEGRRTLWRSDGTTGGTQPVRTSTGAPLNPYNLTVVQGQLLFSAVDDTHGRELWRSDGSAAGTTLLQDIVPGADSSNPQALIAAGQHVFLTADTPGVGRELWALAPGGTPLPTPIPPTPGNQRVYLPLTQR